MGGFLRGPSAPYVIPFAVFIILLAAQDYVPLPQSVEYALRCVILTVVLWIFSRHKISFRLVNPLASIAIGVAVFLIWIGPDALIPGYRQFWLFNNSLTGKASTITEAAKSDVVALFFRSLRAILLVPIIEELFWRAWGLRWVADESNFESMPLGTYTTQSFWIIAGLFAVQHGPYWEVGLICGIIYNWWMGKTRSLGDLILTHAVTNGVLSAYVVLFGKWEYWM